MDFESLYRTYYMKVYSYVMTLVRNPHLAEEITQETFFKALKTKSPCQNHSGEFTWLCAIAKRACIDEQRRQKHLSEFPFGKDAASEDAPEEMLAARAAPDQGISPQNVEQIVEDAQCSLLLHQLLHDLEEPNKEVFQENGSLGQGDVPSRPLKAHGKDGETWIRKKNVTSCNVKSYAICCRCITTTPAARTAVCLWRNISPDARPARGWQKNWPAPQWTRSL